MNLILFFYYKDLNDQSSVKLYVTRNYRPIEFGVLTVCFLSALFDNVS